MKIAIFYGGKSVEHEISIITALQVYESLKGADRECFLIYLDKNNHMYYSNYLSDKKFYSEFSSKNKKVHEIYIENASQPTIKFKHKKKLLKFDIAFLAVHGQGVEDGSLSSLFELLNIPYVGPSIISGSLCQDKILSKIIMNNYKIPTLPSLKINNIKEYPVILKPAHLGSSIGIYVLNSNNDLEEVSRGILNYDDKILIEPYLEDIREFNIAVIGDVTKQELSLIEEVHGSQEILSFNDKYLHSDGMVGINKTIPANIDAKLEQEIKKIALRAFEKLECFGVVRFDFIYDKQKEKLYLNEINSIPGSMAFYLFKNLSFVELIDKLCDLALFKHKRNNNRIRIVDNSKVLKNYSSIKTSK